MDSPEGVPPTDTGFAAAWSPDGATRTFSAVTGAMPADLPFLFAGGQRFGPYLIVRPIGKGGMGQVYEAEEIESGRRVAIKILSRGIGDDEERDRFLSEGRIAASLSHPNLVYVFGTSEVQGLPVIAMELAPAGTLKELLVDGVPLAPAVAVDAIEQVVAGLSAAAAAGILHRDIKPSNCFVAADGRVLVGDFGLSVATLGSLADQGGPAVIAGTPGFASPEQLRGERLDVRSDIYSVGATLYYLLTGHAPIEDDNLQTLITRAATETPAPVTTLRRDVPKGLAAIVTQCLAPTAAKRFPDYAALAAALEPYRSSTPIAAGVWRRLFAGLIDTYIASLPTAPISMKVGGEVLMSPDRPLALLFLPAIFTVVLYYGLLEGFFGAGAGKALLRLRVAQPNGARAGFLRALLRAAIFILPGNIASQSLGYWMLHHDLSQSAQAGASVLALAISCTTMAVLFSTARRRNGYAGLHDLASGTRVLIYKRAVEARTGDTFAAAARALTAGTTHIGPYAIDESIGAEPSTDLSAPILVRGYDERLHRTVWIAKLPAGTPALTPLRRDLGRPARPRWLAGRRTTADCWDAFEATEGTALTDLAQTPQPWSRVRHWLSDLAHEIVAAQSDGSLPALALDRVWIGVDGRARLLDLWIDEGARGWDMAAACRFLCEIAMRALRGRNDVPSGRDAVGMPLPLPARDLLVSLHDGSYRDGEALLSAVDRTLRTPAALSRRTRIYQVAACLALPVVIPVIAFYALGVLTRLLSADPALLDLRLCLDRIEEKRTPPDQRAALETYVAVRLRWKIDDPSTWTRQFPGFASSPHFRGMARTIVDAHANPTPAEIAHADTVAREFLKRERGVLLDKGSPAARGEVVLKAVRYALCATAVLALIAALVLGNGLALRTFGTAIVTRRGAVASRVRVVWRAAIVWAPALLLVVLPSLSPAFRGSTGWAALAQMLLIVVFVAGGIWAALRPTRSIQDLLAGTSLVPR